MTLSAARTFRRTLTFVAVAVALPVVLMGCPKKEAPAAPDAGAPPPPASTPEVTDLAPLVDDAGAEAEASAPKKYAGGGGMTGNQVKIKACCNAMRTQAKAMGSSPEAFQVTSAAAMCDQFASQVGASGSAPEFAQIRGMLKSVTLPAACSF
jgi:hypothetical protein